MQHNASLTIPDTTRETLKETLGKELGFEYLQHC